MEHVTPRVTHVLTFPLHLGVVAGVGLADTQSVHPGSVSNQGTHLPSGSVGCDIGCWRASL
jgi:hypothetical protein